MCALSLRVPSPCSKSCLMSTCLLMTSKKWWRKEVSVCGCCCGEWVTRGGECVCGCWCGWLNTYVCPLLVELNAPAYLTHSLPVCLYTDTRKVYATVVDKHHHLVRKSDGGYDEEEFLTQPHLYKATFSEKVSWVIWLPYWTTSCRQFSSLVFVYTTPPPSGD